MSAAFGNSKGASLMLRVMPHGIFIHLLGNDALVKVVDFRNYVFLSKYLSDFDEDHPLLVDFESNPQYMNYVEDLLKELDGTPNLVIKIREMKNQQWEGIFSELEFARKVKSLNPEFVETEQGVSRTPDLKVNLLGKEVFFEVKMLMETDKSPLVSHELSKIESDLVVELHFDKILNNAEAERLIEFLRNKIKANEIGQFSFEGIGIDICRKRYTTFRKTMIVSATIVPFELIRHRLFSDFKKKLSQLMARKPVFFVIDCQRWNYSHDSFETILCGEKGLFLLKGAECVNGIVAKIRGRTDLFLNPFAKEQLDTDSIGQLREILKHR